MHEVDILVGATEHDLLDRETQDEWWSLIESGELDYLCALAALRQLVAGQLCK